MRHILPAHKCDERCEDRSARIERNPALIPLGGSIGPPCPSITDEGRKFLEENRRSVEDIWGRADEGWDPELAAEMREIWREVGVLGRLFGGELLAGRVDRNKLRRVREVISRTAREIENTLEG